MIQECKKQEPQWGAWLDLATQGDGTWLMKLWEKKFSKPIPDGYSVKAKLSSEELECVYEF